MRGREIEMAKVIVLIKIMPVDESVDVDNLLSKIKIGLPENIELLSVRTEPFVFGLKVINALFRMPDEEGYPNKLEEYLRGFPEVGEFEVSSISRVSS
ncbi:MAG: elongation factor 1-beta [Nitrososphaerota archaeon]